MAEPLWYFMQVFLFRQLLLLAPLPLPLTELTVISPLFSLLFHLGQFLCCLLRRRDIKLADKLQADVNFLGSII